MMKKTPGPRAPPVRSRPSRKITALSYSLKENARVQFHKIGIQYSIKHLKKCNCRTEDWPEQLWPQSRERKAGLQRSKVMRRQQGGEHRYLGLPRKLWNIRLQNTKFRNILTNLFLFFTVLVLFLHAYLWFTTFLRLFTLHQVRRVLRTFSTKVKLD